MPQYRQPPGFSPNAALVAARCCQVQRPSHALSAPAAWQGATLRPQLLRCRPPGLPRIGPPDKIVQSNREVVFLYEDVSGPFFRVVPLDPKATRNDDSETWLGNALGRWEGDTLVVDSRHFNDESWLTDDGAIHSKQLQVTERLRRVGDVIEYQATVVDPVMLAEPWVLRPRRLTRTDIEFGEPAPCIEQDLQHMVDDTHHTNPR